MAAKKKYQKSVALSREIQFYPCTKDFLMFEAYRRENEMKKSEAARVMLRAFFNNMTPDERDRYLKIASKNSY